MYAWVCTCMHALMMEWMVHNNNPVRRFNYWNILNSHKKLTIYGYLWLNSHAKMFLSSFTAHMQAESISNSVFMVLNFLAAKMTNLLHIKIWHIAVIRSHAWIFFIFHFFFVLQIFKLQRIQQTNHEIHAYILVKSRAVAHQHCENE